MADTAFSIAFSPAFNSRPNSVIEESASAQATASVQAVFAPKLAETASSATTATATKTNVAIAAQSANAQESVVGRASFYASAVEGAAATSFSATISGTGTTRVEGASAQAAASAGVVRLASIAEASTSSATAASVEQNAATVTETVAANATAVVALIASGNNIELAEPDSSGASVVATSAVALESLTSHADAATTVTAIADEQEAANPQADAGATIVWATDVTAEAEAMDVPRIILGPSPAFTPAFSNAFNISLVVNAYAYESVDARDDSAASFGLFQNKATAAAAATDKSAATVNAVAAHEASAQASDNVSEFAPPPPITDRDEHVLVPVWGMNNYTPEWAKLIDGWKDERHREPVAITVESHTQTVVVYHRPSEAFLPADYALPKPKRQRKLRLTAASNGGVVVGAQAQGVMFAFRDAKTAPDARIVWGTADFRAVGVADFRLVMGRGTLAAKSQTRASMAFDQVAVIAKRNERTLNLINAGVI